MGAACCSPKDKDAAEFSFPEEPLALSEKAPQISALHLQFQATDFSKHDITIASKPVGLTYVNEVPIVISKVAPGGRAEQAGVQVGWTLLSVNGEEIRGRTFEQFVEMMKPALDALDTD
mmetsp:Transcript_37967/g.80729  ORF Transcript_37967/g.80729 Transcript_37967/m.80729 type:complete len:119 (+) Transcript_37967:107-463(+)